MFLNTKKGIPQIVKFCFLNQLQTFCLKRNQSSLRKKICIYIGWKIPCSYFYFHPYNNYLSCYLRSILPHQKNTVISRSEKRAVPSNKVFSHFKFSFQIIRKCQELCFLILLKTGIDFKNTHLQCYWVWHASFSLFPERRRLVESTKFPLIFLQAHMDSCIYSDAK